MCMVEVTLTCIKWKEHSQLRLGLLVRHFVSRGRLCEGQPRKWINRNFIILKNPFFLCVQYLERMLSLADVLELFLFYFEII